jgi:hypothetical protein
MSTKHLLVCLIATLAVAAFATDFVARVTFPNNRTEVVTVTTNTTTLPGTYWDAAEGGGHYEMTFQITNGMVVIAHHTSGSYQGIGSEVIHWTRIPTNKIPYTFTVSQHTVTVTHVESKARSK